MGRWKLEYYNAGWIEFTGTVEETIEELNGHEEATFKIPNIADNRTFVSTDQIIRIKFDDIQVFLGALFGVEYSLTRLKCIVYNGVYELLKRRVISGNYVNTPANVVAEAVRIAAGLINPLGSCPTTPITVEFDQTLCFDAIELIAKILNKDHWTQNGDTLYIGARGSSQSFDGTIAKVSTRGLDRSKKRNKVHFRGVNESGEQIMGVAGTGDNVAVFWSHNATSITTLNALAAQKLAEINSDDSGVTLTCPITSGAHLHSGDTITINKPELNLFGSYKIKKITKHRKTVDIEVSRPKKCTEDILEELTDSNTEALNFVGQEFPFDSWEGLIDRFGLFPKRGILWKDIWRYMPNINKSLIPASDNTYDIGDILTPLRWKSIFGIYVFPSYFGPFSDTPAIVQFWTKNKAGTEIVDHEFDPTDHEHGVLGSFTKSWKEAHAKYFITTYLGYYRIWNTGEDNPLAELTKESISFGPGGTTALDVYLKRIAADTFELKAWYLWPAGDNVTEVGSLSKKFKKIYASNYLIINHFLPYVNNTYDLGQGGETPLRWRNLRLSGFLEAGGYEIVTAARILQNVTANTGIITSGQFLLARLPRSTAGYVLEAEGTEFDPMYVDPNYRYMPKSHDHAAETLNPTAVNCNTMSIAASCNRQYTHPSAQQCVYASSCAWEYCPHFTYQYIHPSSQQCVYASSIAWEVCPHFNFLDDLKIIKNLRTKGKDKNGLPLIDPASLPPEVMQDGLINVRNLVGLLIGAIGQLAAEVETLKKQNVGG